MSATAELNPPDTPVVTVELPLLPCTTDTLVGEAAIVNEGVGVVEPVNAPSNPELGLPHPVTRSKPVVAE